MISSGRPDPTAVYPDPRETGEQLGVPRRVSVGQVFALVAGFVALAAIGAMIGWTVTDSPPSPTDVAGAVTSPSAGAVSSSPTSSPTPQPTLLGYTLPDYQAQGSDFVTARKDLISHRLGVRLYFNSGGAGSTVVRTDPPAGATLQRGITVKVYVSGPAPTLEVRDVVGQGCSKGGKDLAADGLMPQYPNGKNGVVAATDPTAGTPNVYWNGKIQVRCTPDGTLPEPSDGPSVPASSGSPVPSPSF